MQWERTAFETAKRFYYVGPIVTLSLRHVHQHLALGTKRLSRSTCSRMAASPNSWLATSHYVSQHPVPCQWCKPLVKVDASLQSNFHRHFSTSSNDGIDNELQSEEPPGELKIPGAEKGGKKLAIIFTCTQCNTRSAKQFTENAYKHGVVIATCPGCQNRHLIADNLGFFSDEEGGWTIEKGMAKLGKNVRIATNDDVLELRVEDIYTKEAIDEAVEKATKGISKPEPSGSS